MSKVTLIKYKSNYRILIEFNGIKKIINDIIPDYKKALKFALKIAKNHEVILQHKDKSTYNYFEVI